MTSPDRRIPVTILTGFLGAGKTTLLNRLLREPGFDKTAVVVNEFGEIGLDGELVETAADRAFAMTTGCLCCTVSGDIRLSLLRLVAEAQRGEGPSFDRMVVETTGMADPAPVLATFMNDPAMRTQFTVNGVVTLVDAASGADSLDRFEEARRQVGFADILLISKADLVSEEEAAALRARLAAMNGAATRAMAGDVTAADIFSLAAFDPAGRPPDVLAWLGAAQTPHDHHHHHHHHHHHDHSGDSVSTFAFQTDAALDPGTLEMGLAALQNSFGADLLRLKALAKLSDDPGKPAVLHIVQRVWSPPSRLDAWPSGDARTRLVMIVAGAARAQAAAMLLEFFPEFEPVGETARERAPGGGVALTL